MVGQFPTRDEFTACLPNEETCIAFLESRDVFYTSFDCSSCDRPMRRYIDKRTFRCTRRACARYGHSTSMRIGTFFYQSALKCVQIMGLAHYWLAGTTANTCILLTGHSSTTVSAFYRHFRQLATSALREENQIIGGPGIVVEIDETKLGKRKYNRGHRVDGVWVVVGIERRQNGKIFLIPVEDRSAQTLQAIIESHVLPNSIVNTDGWRGYTNLDALGLTHMVVNHSQTFVDPVTSACTNTAEGLNSGLKRRIPIRNRVKEGIEDHLGEYVWRRQNKERLFDAFVEALRDVHYDIE
jgi:transposase-like protein